MPPAAEAATVRRAVVVFLLLLGSPAAPEAQETCASTEDPGDEEWEAVVSRRTALDSLYRETIGRAREEDDRSRPAGVIAATVDTATGKTEVVVEARGMSETARDALVRRFVGHLEARPVEREETVVLDLRRGVETGIPRGEGAVERCPPILANRDEVAAELEEAARRVLDFMDEAGDEARDARRQVLLDVILSRSGTVEKVMVARPSGNPYLNVQAREVGRRMRFEPATLNGVPVAEWIRVPVNFDLPDPD